MNCISELIYDGLIGHARNLRILECQIRQGYFRWNTYIYHLCLFSSFSLFMFRLVLLSILNIFKYNSEFFFFWRNELTNDPFHSPCVSVMHPWISIPLKNTCQKVSWLWIWSIWAVCHLHLVNLTLQCTEEAHRPVDCGTVAKWILKNSAESENMNWYGIHELSIAK